MTRPAAPPAKLSPKTCSSPIARPLCPPLLLSPFVLPTQPTSPLTRSTNSQALTTSLYAVHNTASSLPPNSVPGIPEPLIQYVENGRNPDIYTREFVELVRRMNQLARGKMHAFTDFRDVLAREMNSALPEVRGDVQRVLEATGGESLEVKGENGEAGNANAAGTGMGQRGQ